MKHGKYANFLKHAKHIILLSNPSMPMFLSTPSTQVRKADQHAEYVGTPST